MDTNSKKNEQIPATRDSSFHEGDVVRYRGTLCRIVAVLNRSRAEDGRPWYFYDLREEYGDGEYNDVGESSLLRQRDPGKKNKKRPAVALHRFFHYVNCHGDDVWFNVFRIVSIVGKEVKMVDGDIHALTREQADELTALIGCGNLDRTEDPA